LAARWQRPRAHPFDRVTCGRSPTARTLPRTSR
jgi:hypothetical protein